MKPARKRNDDTDLPESKRDEELLKPDEATLDLPDVKDIPGQEHVRPFLPAEMADTTISSADEEGSGLLDAEPDDDIVTDRSADVTKTERELLRRSSESMASKEDEQLREAELDKVDDEGTPLNEKTNFSGSDLDVPGSEQDDANEKAGSEDEENNPYSLSDEEEG
ncbi:MAG TPA: hypothetical protein VFP97_05405 [Chitinophagaceae bacterium]|nr:hypothetical protein [Chitinophagaceae bacterium]